MKLRIQNIIRPPSNTSQATKEPVNDEVEANPLFSRKNNFLQTEDNNRSPSPSPSRLQMLKYVKDSYKSKNLKLKFS